MSELQFTSIDRIISKFHRDLRGTDVNESDMVEWIGEALEFLKVPQIQDQAIAQSKLISQRQGERPELTEEQEDDVMKILLGE